MESKIQEGALILSVKDIIYFMKGNFYNKRMDINQHDSQNTINVKNFALTKQFDLKMQLRNLQRKKQQY